ncbi:MAG: peptidylprolyl isomerase, partial [Candidatus Competibacteraceae bacterium]|nr:peptidylprolyl isomerase [Candidatus Competibacteraceae bacterium]
IENLQSLAAELNGQIRDLGFVTMTGLRAIDPRALRFAFLLRPGEHSPPYSQNGSLVMFKVLARQEPDALPLAMVRDRVVQDYLTYYSPQVYEELAQQMLAEAAFRLYPERLAGISPLTANPG